MSRFVFIVLFACLLSGCQGTGMKLLSPDQEEVIMLAYLDSKDARDVQGTSSSGESFSGNLQWKKGQRNSGRYDGVLVGESGRSIQVSIGCNALRSACAGTGKDDDGTVYFVF